MTKDIEYQLFREIKIQMFLDHPNIIKLYHFYVDS
jgi:serine/threonine protein kinase